MPYYPHRNGQAELTNKTIVDMIKKEMINTNGK